MKTQRVTMAIENLHGAAECPRIMHALERVRGVVYAYVNPRTEMAYVEYDPAQCVPSHLQETVRQLGFHAEAPSRR